MKKIDTYNGEINEFVDWVTGNNTLTNRNESDGLPISGGSIRKLVQDRLRDPFYLYLDKTDALYRIFSSKEACDIWNTNREAYAHLVKGEFLGPSQYSVLVTLNTASELYIKKSDSTTVPISYNWAITDSQGTPQVSQVSVQVVIRNEQNIQTGALPIYTYNSATFNATISDIYPYLNSGTNYVTIEVNAIELNTVGAVTFIALVVDLLLSTDFNNFNSIAAQTPVNLRATLSKSLSGNATIYAYLDGEELRSLPITGTGSSLVGNYSFDCPELEGIHTLVMYASMSNESGNATIYSNALYYNFVTSITDPTSAQRYLLIAHSFEVNSSEEILQLVKNMLTFNIKQHNEFILDWGYYYVSAGSAEVTWHLEKDDDYIQLLTVGVASNNKGTSVKYIPATQGEYKLVGYIGSVKSFELPVNVTKGYDVSETAGYSLKLNAYGKTNEVDRTWNYNNITTTFSPSVNFTSTAGWFENSLRLSGVNNYATINFNPFNHKATDGAFTFEIEFYTEYVNDNDDVLLSIGNLFKIYPNKAVLCTTSATEGSEKEIIWTNFKSNERIKLAFIVNGPITTGTDIQKADSNLAFIVNNGILERGASVSGLLFNQSNAIIKIGGSNSGIRVYSIRHYNYALTYNLEYDNYVFDSTNKGQIITNNDILNKDGKIDADKCANKLDIVIIEGNLSALLNADTNKEDSETDVNITRRCNYDISKNFEIKNGKIRKHGQSTLNYPIPSFKIWSNSAKTEGIIPELDWLYNPGYHKNRYTMKDASIPANKWILQANYADSSGVHNGGLQRLIQDTWYNAKIKIGEKEEFKLRSAPQLFATNETITFDDGSENAIVNGYNQVGKKMKDYSSYSTGDFPYVVRISPDSFPCVVFYKNTADEANKDYIFLGQYVFMEDKKSDYCYGQRSMYNVPNDPFCLYTINKDLDTKDNRMWSNENVLRIEVLTVDSPFSSYLTDEGFEDIIYKVDKDKNITDIPDRFRWENDFELIYPDSDDLELDATKFLANSKFVARTKPFVEWFKWIVSCKKGQTDFKATAAQHLDLYKMAAYYIFCMRFGLVDSMERNVQIKTYDGKHFHYEPWDMDIALGNRNTGGIAFNPPIDRTTVEAGSTDKFALSGHDNYLWNQLEGWNWWIDTVVPAVAEALFKSGLSYDNIIEMFDNNYQNKWNELIYNQSGHFKYVEQNSGEGASDYLAWLQGARTTHRHWWLKASMDYWDAKWACGDFKNHSIYAATTKAAGKAGIVRLTASTKTYFNYALNYIMKQLKEASADLEITYDLTNESISPKVPFSLYGTLYVKDLDISCLAAGLSVLRLGGAYSDETGSNLKTLNFGNTITGNKLAINNTQLSVQDMQKMISLEELNMAGQHNLMTTSFTAPDKLKKLNAVGTNINAFQSSASGNDFVEIKLPDTLSSITMYDSSWQSLEFYNLTLGQKVETEEENEEGETVKIEYYEDSIITKTDNLYGILTVTLKGATGTEACSKDFVFKWLDSILTKNGDKYVEKDSNHKIYVENIKWSGVTYEQVKMLAAVYHDGNTLKGYIQLSGSETLTNDQLLQLTTWFGDSVFVLNGGGLTIDYPNRTESVVLGTPAYSLNGEIYIKEQEEFDVRLRFVKFQLQNSDDDAEWRIGGINADVLKDLYKGCKVFKEVDRYDGTTKWYMTVKETSSGDYDIRVQVVVNGRTYNQIVHIIAVTYPTAAEIVTNTTEGIQYVDGYYVILKISTTATFKVDFKTSYTASISSTTWTLENNNAQSVDEDKYVRFSSDKTASYIYCKDADEEAAVIYNLKAHILFFDKNSMDISVPVHIYNDYALVDSGTPYLFSVFQQTDANRLIFYRSNVVITESLDMSGSPENFSFITLHDDTSVIQYLKGIKTLNFSNNTLISFTGEDKYKVDLTKVPTLENLNLSGATKCTGGVDTWPALKTLNTQNTTLNVAANGGNLTSVYLGTPTSIVLMGLNNLLNLTILNTSRVHTFRLESVPKIKNAFTRLLDIYNSSTALRMATINQSSTEILTSDQFDQMAEIAQKINTTNMTGKIQLADGLCYDDSYTTIVNKWGSTLQIVNNPLRCIRFKSPEFEQWLCETARIDSDNNGKITNVEALSVVNFGTKFSNATFDYDIDLSPFTNYKIINVATSGNPNSGFTNTVINGDLILNNIRTIHTSHTWNTWSGRLIINANKIVFGNLDDTQLFYSFLGDCNIGVLQFSGMKYMRGYDGTTLPTGETIYRANDFYMSTFCYKDATCNIGLLILDDIVTIYSGVFRNEPNHLSIDTVLINSENFTEIKESNFDRIKLNTFLMPNVTSVPTLLESCFSLNVYNESGYESCAIYVPDALVADFKTATNWNKVASKIYPMSQYNGDYKMYIK